MALQFCASFQYDIGMDRSVMLYLECVVCVSTALALSKFAPTFDSPLRRLESLQNE